METETARISILCNPPKGFPGNITMIFGINDEKIGEGHPGETVVLNVPKGIRDILVLVKNESINSISGTTKINVNGDMSLKIKYRFFVKSATLVENR